MCLVFAYFHQGEKGFKGDPGTPGQNGAKVCTCMPAFVFLPTP